MNAVIECAGYTLLMLLIEGCGMTIADGARQEGATPAGIGIGSALFSALPAVIKFPTILVR